MPTSVRKERLLVVDDAADTREVLQRNLTAQGYQVFTATNVPEAARALDSAPVDLVITDLKMPGASGLDLVRHVREKLQDVEVLMISGYPAIEAAARGAKAGAEECLAKPFTQEELLGAVRRSLDKLRVRKALRAAEGKADPRLVGLVAESDSMRKVVEAVQKAAASTDPVLITGESGTGKELAARAVHYRSPRASAPFLPVKCGRIPQELLESELFGHAKGAFEGASEARGGFFQAAEGGTLFLDGISEVNPSLQAMLLRALKEGEICPVGSARPRAVDVRLVAATSVDLARLAERGLFREELFHRLSAITLSMPPLRQRGNDIVLLAHQFAAKFATTYGRPEPRFTDLALEVMRGYTWPGNVRELEVVIQRVVATVGGDEIDAPDLPSTMRFSRVRETGLDHTLAHVETDHIRAVLAHVKGNKTRAAEILGIDRKTLREKLKVQERK